MGKYNYRSAIFSDEFPVDLFGRNPITLDGVLVLIGLSLGISIVVYILLAISSKENTG